MLEWLSWFGDESRSANSHKESVPVIAFKLAIRKRGLKDNIFALNLIFALKIWTQLTHWPQLDSWAQLDLCTQYLYSTSYSHLYWVTMFGNFLITNNYPMLYKTDCKYKGGPILKYFLIPSPNITGIKPNRLWEVSNWQ